MFKNRFSFRFLISTLSHLNFRRKEECSTLIRWLEAKAGERILDVGCGDGYYDKIISKSGAEVIGIDICKRRISVAQRLYRSENTEFIYMDAEEMAFPDASFDKVVSFSVLEHLCNEERVMKEISRTLKTDGYFVFSVDSLSNPVITEEERTRHKQRYAVKNFYTVENLQEMLLRTGFDIKKAQYILSTPLELALARLSWRLDDLPRGLVVVRLLGYLDLFIIWKAASFFLGQSAGHSRNGLTLLVLSKKRIDTQQYKENLINA